MLEIVLFERATLTLCMLTLFGDGARSIGLAWLLYISLHPRPNGPSFYPILSLGQLIPLHFRMVTRHQIPNDDAMRCNAMRCDDWMRDG